MLGDHGPNWADHSLSQDETRALKNLGYAAYAIFGPEGAMMENSDGKQPEALKAALVLLPHDHKYIDDIVQNWLNRDDQSYALDPTEFMAQYERWWATPREKVTPSLTSLILRVFACSLRFLARGGVTEFYGMNVQELTDNVHTAANEVSNSIQPGEGGVSHVQGLFLTAIWLESTGQKKEAWHTLNKALTAALEIGLHKSHGGMSESDRERARRLWVILCLWDDALSSDLSLPLHFNPADPAIEVSPLPIEGNQPSVFRHLDLHYQLCVSVAAAKPRGESEVRSVISEWFENIPEEYKQPDPDTRWDEEWRYLPTQRRYLSSIGSVALFNHTMGKRLPLLQAVKEGLSLVGQERSVTETPVPQHILAYSPPPSQLSKPPKPIMEAFERFMKSAFSDLDNVGKRDEFHFLMAQWTGQHPALHPDTENILLSLCIFQELINRKAHGNQYPPTDGLLDNFEHWLICGARNESDPASLILWFSAGMAFEHLVGHARTICKRGGDCKGGMTCDEKMTLEWPSFGHLYHFAEILRSEGSREGLYATCWHMAHAIMEVLRKELLGKGLTGFRHGVLSNTPPWSIWKNEFYEYWKAVLCERRGQEDAWVDFRDRIIRGLREVQSTDLDDDEESEDPGLEECPDDGTKPGDCLDDDT